MFSFGNTNTPPSLGFSAAAATPQKTGFGTGFGTFGTNTAPTTTAAGSAFGGFGTSFGAPAASSAPAFGFGTNTATTAAPNFGATSAFGATGTTSTFGNPAATTFGTPATGLGGFGQTPAATTSLFGGGFNAPASTSFSGFGAATSTFGTGNTFGTGSAFGKPATTGGFGGFGSSLPSFGQTQPPLAQQLQPPPPNPNEAFFNSVYNCSVYGDDRDSILARWNSLQACWGTGKGYYSNNAPPVEFTQQNPMCRFKAIGYSCMPGRENREGLVAIIFNKKENEIKSQQPQLISSLSAVLGNKPTLTVNIENIKCLSDCKTQVLIYVQEKGVTGTMKKIPATELGAYLIQPMQKQQLCSLGVENVLPHVLPDQDQLQEYLQTPPEGIDHRLWKQAQADNPNSAKYIPVPMVGFGEVKWRMKCQEEETKRHQAFLDKVAEDISCLQRKHTSTTAKIAEQQRKYIELQHRVLQIIVKQETTRKAGLALQPEEELLRSQLEAMQTQISAPTQFKGRLSELLSQIRMQRCQSGGLTQYNERYTMDKGAQDDMKQFLSMQQRGLSQLIEIVNQDMDTLKVIHDGMTKLLQDKGVVP